MTNDSVIDAQEAVQVAIQGVMAFNLWATVNLPGREWLKKITAAVLAVLQLVTTVMLGGIDVTEWMNLSITALTALGVLVLPQPVTVTNRANTEARTFISGDPRLQGDRPRPAEY